MRPLLLLLLVLTLFSLPGATTADAQYCRCECRWTQYGRECRRVCYAPQRTYQAPVLSYSSGPGSQFPVAPELLLGVLLIVGAVAIAVALSQAGSSNTEALVAETNAVRENTANIHSEIDRTKQRTRDIDEYMTAAARESFERGRRAAEAGRE